jgi:hypothetical protein
MLYYVYSRSEHVDRMEYKVLSQMLEEASRTTKKQRPESSTPAKLKDANQHKAARLD